MVSEIAASLGVEHHMVTLEWAEGERMTESVARHRRYPALMEQCRKAKAGILMVGHSQDDQIGGWCGRVFLRWSVWRLSVYPAVTSAVMK